MLNIELGFSTVFGLLYLCSIFLIIKLKLVQSELCKEKNSFLSTIGIFYASILAKHNWRLNPNFII